MKRRQSFWLLAIFVFIGICFVGTTAYVMNVHAVSISAIEMTEKGDSRDEVLERFGKPLRIDRTENGESWVYSGMTWCIVTVYMDDAGMVERVEHNH